MTANMLLTGRTARRWAIALSAGGLLALAGCKTDREARDIGGGRRSDPLVAGPKLIPRQDLPVPEWGIGSKGKDPLTSPTGGRGEKAGYTDDPERFKGTVLPSRLTMPAALAGRNRDGDELKIDDTGVTLQPAGGVVPADIGAGISALYNQLEKLGVKREDRSIEREGGKYVFRASKTVSPEGARRQFTGEGNTAYDAVKQVIDQLAEDKN